jgi:hypothetical protein
MTDDYPHEDEITRYRVEGWLSMPISATLLADKDDDIDDISLELQREVLLDQLPDEMASIQEFARMNIDVDHVEPDEQ